MELLTVHNPTTCKDLLVDIILQVNGVFMFAALASIFIGISGMCLPMHYCTCLVKVILTSCTTHQLKHVQDHVIHYAVYEANIQSDNVHNSHSEMALHGSLSCPVMELSSFLATLCSNKHDFIPLISCYF